MAAEKKMPETLRHVLSGRASMLDLALEQGNHEAARLILDHAIRDAFTYGMLHVEANAFEHGTPLRSIIDSAAVHAEL
jgi:hypothetical protein